MTFIQHCDSPLGGILLAADEIGLTGLWFDGQKYFARDLPAERIDRGTPILAEAGRWLDIYFRGQEPDFLPPLHPIGSAFRQSVWEILLRIPYGQTMTYGEIARQLAEKKGLSQMSAQAVGGAVGHNGTSIIIPCHRVVGTNGSLTGYAGELTGSAGCWNWSMPIRADSLCRSRNRPWIYPISCSSASNSSVEKNSPRVMPRPTQISLMVMSLGFRLLP